jgi:HD-GYP domain-containing protein (c-di-GMP phosphodiesterase class II)
MTDAGDLRPGVPVGAAPDLAASGGPGVPLSDWKATHYSVEQAARATELLKRLWAVRRAAKLYPLEHPAVTENVRSFSDVVRAFHAEGVDVELAFFEGEIFLGDLLLAEQSLLFDQLIRDMAEMRVGSVVIRRGITDDEFVRAVGVLGADAGEVARGGGAEALLSTIDAPHVSISAVRALQDEEEIVETHGRPRVSYRGAVSLIRGIHQVIQGGAALDASRVNSTVRSLVGNVLANRPAMLQISGLRDFNEYTYYHSTNVAILSLSIGSALSTDNDFLTLLGAGALLHDIGKLLIPISVLDKPGKLSDDEWAEMRKHPLHGAEIAFQTPGLDRGAILPILEHHMRWDNTGYPDRRPTRQQHLLSRIVAIADAYDAMTAQRVYSKGRVPGSAVAEVIAGAGTAFDPDLVRVFVRVMGMYPPGSVLRISTGEIAISIAPNPADPARPAVRVVADSAGNFVHPRDEELVERDLSVLEYLDPAEINIDVGEFI